MGFVGRNGAGKTTTRKAVMNIMVQSDSEAVFLFEQNSREQ